MQLNNKRWTPDLATKFEVVDEAAQVWANRSIRLIQMRRIAKSFDAYVVKSRSEEKLRLLPEPLYRYPVDLDPERIIDGGLFAFVEATDPEILLLLEARE